MSNPARLGLVTLQTPENYRALAQNFYGAGADGVTVFNFQYHWARRTGTARYPGPVEVRLTRPATGTEGDIIIDEVEVVVIPKL